MKRTACRIALLLFLSSTFACQGRPPEQPDAAANKGANVEATKSGASGPGVRWPIPAGWKEEAFALPPGFAPTLTYHGTEDLRFMPGFSSPNAPDFWSYDLVW